MEIKDILTQIGIDGKKADVYLACLELGGATAYLISKKIGLKRPTVYDIANQLMKEGLIHKSIKGNIKYFSPADPDVLLSKLKEREEKVRSILPSLHNLYNAPKIKPFIRYFEGKEGIREMCEDSLRNLRKGDIILAYVGEGIVLHLPEYANDYIERRIKKGIRLKGIYKNDGTILTYMEKNQEQLREVKILDKKDFPFNNEINIYQNKVAVASYGQEMFGMLIESAEFAKAQRAIFTLAWRGAESFEKK